VFAFATILGLLDLSRLRGVKSADSKLAFKGGVQWIGKKFIEEGWATMPGEKKPDRKVAEDCG